MPTSPKALVCMDCRTTFEYTAEEQGYFASRGYRAPIRCQGDAPRSRKSGCR